MATEFTFVTLTYDDGKEIVFQYPSAMSKRKVLKEAKKYLAKLEEEGEFTEPFRDWIARLEERIKNKDFVMKFGKHKGYFVTDMPMPYIMWLYHLDDYDDLEIELRNAIERRIQKFIYYYQKSHTCNN